MPEMLDQCRFGVFPPLDPDFCLVMTGVFLSSLLQTVHIFCQYSRKGMFPVPLSSDFQNILEVFIFTNLPVLTNPNAAKSVLFTNNIVPTTPTSPIVPTTPITPASPVTPTTPTSTPTVLFIPPEVALALQTAVLTNFNDLRLPRDIQNIAQAFFANLPPIPHTPVTPVTPVTG